MEDRRFIEDSFPIKEVGEESAREKSIRGENIATLHTWWARKPLGSTRAVNFESLILSPQNAKEAKVLKNLVVEIAKFRNSSNESLLSEARVLVLKSNGGRTPKVLDPFAGGGSIPFEALRLGCETYACDYNPVAVLIEKCTFEYPQKYSSRSSIPGEILTDDRRGMKLISDLNKWGKWILVDTTDRIMKFYPAGPGHSTPVCYIWARTIPCQNPTCGAEVPLLPQYWLSRNGKTGVSLYPFVRGGIVSFRIVGNRENPIPEGFDPEKGNISRAVATCLVCGSVMDNKTTSALFRREVSSERLIAVIYHKKGQIGKIYKVAEKGDLDIVREAQTALQSEVHRLSRSWGISPVPDEPTPEGSGPGAERAISLRNYNMNNWGDLFNKRQTLMLLTFVDSARRAYESMLREGYENEYAKAILTYLALGIDRLVDYGSTLCTLNSTGGRGVKNTFGRPILQMVWTYAESNPFNPVGGGWAASCEKNENWVRYASNVPMIPTTVVQSSATSIPYQDDFFDAVLTDPPYYDNIPYSYLSDFFYVWLKRILGDLSPDLFATPLSPKAEEIVAYSNRQGGFNEGKRFFLDMLRKSFSEIFRVLKPNGIATIVYAHKSTSGWETLIDSLLSSGLVVTAAWPVRTEKKGRLRSQESAALASSIYMVARKFEKQRTGFYTEVRQELRNYLNKKLDRMWSEGISGADFFISAIGSAIEVFGKYVKVIDDEGNSVKADRLLEEIRRIVTDYAIRQVLHNGFAAEIKPMTRFYVLWRWAYADKLVNFDEARKLGQSVGIDVSQEWKRGFIRKEKEFIKVLGPEERNHDELQGPSELIDVLHHVLLLWKKGKSEEITTALRDAGYGESDAFYRVGEAISESLPNDSREKKLLEGFLAGRERITKEVRKQVGQRRLDE